MVTEPAQFVGLFQYLPSGQLTVCYGKSPFLIGKSTMVIFNSYVRLPEGT